MKYYKGFNNQMQGRNEFQFCTGMVYEKTDDDSWTWFHYTDKVSSTLRYFDENIRICEVLPLGEVYAFKDYFMGNNSSYYTTNKIEILRELSRKEIYDTLEHEKFSFYLLISKLKPEFEILYKYKNKIRGDYCREIIIRDDLDVSQKKILLPKNWHKFI